MANGASEGDRGSVIITAELDRRPSRPPDYGAENSALLALAEAMSVNPDTVLQQLAELAMELTRSGSAGISLLESENGGEVFRWAATTGAWSRYLNGTVPYDASLCGEMVTENTALLVKNPERAFPELQQADPLISEALLAPFCLGGVPVGTLWMVKHDLGGQFEAEDARILRSLARFAAEAHHTVKALEAAMAAKQISELRAQQFAAMAEISTGFIATCDIHFMPLYANAAAMQMIGLDDLDHVKRTPFENSSSPKIWRSSPVSFSRVSCVKGVAKPKYVFAIS